MTEGVLRNSREPVARASSVGVIGWLEGVPSGVLTRASDA
jgi:hypothetical protein